MKNKILFIFILIIDPALTQNGIDFECSINSAISVAFVMLPLVILQI